MTVNFKTWELSTEHAACCSYGQPVLVNRATGDAYGAGDILKPYPSWPFLPAAAAVARMAATATLTHEETAIVEQFTRLRTRKGVPKARQDELIAEATAAAQPGARVGPFTIPGEVTP